MIRAVENKNAGMIQVINGKNPKSLYLHQVDAIRQLNEKINGQSHYEGLLVLPTGGGKTLTAVQWVLRNVIDQGEKVLWIAHRHELLNQALKTVISNSYTDVLPNRKTFTFRLISGMHDRPVNINHDDDIIIASKDSICHSLSLLLDKWGIKNTDVVFLVIDEAHHAVAKSYRQIINTIKENNPASFKMLGLTATPFRTSPNEKGSLKSIFKDDIAYGIDLRTLISRAILSDPIFIDSRTKIDMARNLTDNDIKLIHSSSNLPQDVAENIALNKERNKLIIDHYLEHSQKYGQTLIFAVTIHHAIELKALFERYGVLCDYVVSSIKDSYTGVTVSNEQNEEKIQAFKNGAIKILINVNILTEGTDLPTVQTVFLTRPTISTILMTQMIGRALRGEQSGGTKQAYIVSFIDEWENKISWINPRKLYEDHRTFLDMSPTERQDHMLRLIAISKIEEFTKMMDDTIDTEDLEKLSFVERIPVGIYSFSVLLSSGNGEMNEKYSDIMVYDMLQNAYNEFVNDLEDIFKYNGLAEKEYLKEAELEYLCSEVRQEYFQGYNLDFGYHDDDVKDILCYFAQTSTKPVFLPLEERQKYNIYNIAKEIWDNDMGIQKQTSYLDQLWNEEKSFFRVFFCDTKKYFINQIHKELYKLSEGIDTVMNPVVQKEQRELNKLNLGELRKFAPDYYSELVNAVYEKHKDTDGYFCSAISDFRSKSKFYFQIDHIKPLSKGGLTEINNLQLLTRKENLLKRDIYYDENSNDPISGQVPWNEFNKQDENDQKFEIIMNRISELIKSGIDVNKEVEAIEKQFSPDIDSMFYKRLGKLYGDSGNDGKAKAAYRKAIELNNNPRGVLESLYNMANIFFYEGNISESEQYLNLCLERNSEFVHALALMGMLKHNCEQYEEAMRFYNKAVNLGADFDWVYLFRGDILSSEGNYEQALAEYQKAVKLNSEKAEAYLGIGTVHYFLGKYKVALKYIDRGLEINNKNENGHYYKACCLKELKKYDNALDSLKQTVLLDPRDAGAYLEMGIIYDLQKNHREALRYIDKALEINADAGLGHYYKGRCLHKMKQYDAAIEALEKAVSLLPQDADAFFELAFILDKKKRYEAAIKNYNMVILLDPEDVVALNNLGYTYQKMKDFDSAMKYYKKALEIDPNYKLALANKEKLIARVRRQDGI